MNLATSGALLLATLFCVSALGAQTFLATPPDRLASPGNTLNPAFGSTPNGRRMFLDGELFRARQTLTAVAFRRATYVGTFDNVARSWRLVTLTLAEGDVDRVSATFAQNQLTTPTLVFAKPVAWPGYRTARSVETFGGIAGELSFPFLRPWTYSGTRDVCLDFDFTGGALGNGAAWQNTQQVDYRLDAELPTTTAIGRFAGSVAFGRSCRDSSQSVDALVSLQANTFGPTYVRFSNLGFVTNQTMLFASHGAIGSPQRYGNYQPSIHLLSLWGSRRGVTVPGVACARLHLDLSKSVWQFAPPIGRPYHGAPPLYRALHIPATKGLPVWYQAAWQDSRNGRLRLTHAALTQIPGQPGALRHRVVFEDDPTKKGSAGRIGATPNVPVLRYKY